MARVSNWLVLEGKNVWIEEVKMTFEMFFFGGGVKRKKIEYPPGN